LYAAGSFGTVGGIAHQGAASFLLSSLNLQTWNPGLSYNGNPASATLRAVYADDNNVYLGGNFDLVGATSRKFLAQVNPTTAAVKAWDPSTNGLVYRIAKSGTNILAGGSFQYMKGDNRNYLACIDAATGLLTTWNPGAD
jgi:hypothetical protein